MPLVDALGESGQRVVLVVERDRRTRNRLVGLVTSVVSDTVMSQVELQCGPHRIVSLISTEAVRELNLEPGSVATAVVKATAVSIETAAQS